MKTDAPPLLPIFRSDGQARLLAYLFLRPQEQTTLSALAGQLGLSHTTVSREADKLEAAGLIRSERVGNQRRLRRDEDSVYFRPLEDLLLRAFGPVPLLERALRAVGGVELAFIYGSWAARYLGIAGEAPNDLDVLIVGSPQRAAIAAIGSELEGQLGYAVHPVIVPHDEWRQSKRGFLRSIASGPLVELELGHT
jgi:DNA-binding transcriptional ArsR family regulator